MAEMNSHGYRTAVYTDDKLKYCLLFKAAARELQKTKKDFNFRLYLMLNDSSGLNKKTRLFCHRKFIGFFEK